MRDGELMCIIIKQVANARSKTISDYNTVPETCVSGCAPEGMTQFRSGNYSDLSHYSRCAYSRLRVDLGPVHIAKVVPEQYRYVGSALYVNALRRQ